MSTSNVKLLVDQLTLQALDTGETYNQTSVLPLPSYYELAALSEHLHIPRSRLAGKLLAAAIRDAIKELPYTGPYNHLGQDFSTPAELIAFLAWDFEQNDKLAERQVSRLRAKGALIEEVEIEGNEQT
jgi:hypothetical protein